MNLLFRQRTCLACIVLFGSQVMAQQSPPTIKRYALLIAVTKYSHASMNNPELVYPEIDAKDVGNFLSAHGYEVEYLLGPQATKTAISAKLEQLATKGNDGGVCVVGLWGHGVEFDGSDEAMFCPYDTTIRLAVDSLGRKLFNKTGDRMTEPAPKSLIGMSQVLGGLRICGASNRLLLADCCRNSPNRPRGRAFGSNVTLKDLPDNTAAIFACKANEQAFEDRRWGHGAMTKALLDLLPEMVTRQDTSVTSLLNPLKRDVASLVNEASKGRDRQTIHPIFNGLPDLKLQSTTLPEWVKNRFGMEFRLIPSGEFLMGSPEDEKGRDDDETQHRVKISRDFYLQTTEVTQGQWKSLMGTEPWKGKDYVKEGSDYPATYVSWEDATLFCRKLSEREGVEYRLPTEAEWEYACRAGSRSAYSFGDDASNLSVFAWFDKNAWDQDEKYAHRVGQKQPNGFGIYDMHGNVWEWCSDWYGEDYYQKSPLIDPTGASGGSLRVYRGGSWNGTPRSCRSAFRYGDSPSYRSYILGFRVLRSSVK